MSTHNIGFYEDLTKIIFELSSNITKYAPYFFCYQGLLVQKLRIIRKKFFGSLYPVNYINDIVVLFLCF